MPKASNDESAGVYNQTIDLSDRIIAASTSVGAIVGEAPKGPVMKPTLVRDQQEYERKFGYGSPSKFGYMAQCSDPYLKASKNLEVVRVVNGALTAGSQNPKFALTNFDDGSSNTPKGKLEPGAIQFIPGTDGVDLILAVFYGIDPGLWNDQIFLSITPSNPEGVSYRSNGHNPKTFYVEVFINYKGGEFESPAEKFLCSRSEELDGEDKQLFLEDVINNPTSGSKIIRVINNPHCENLDVVNSCFEQFGGGSDGDRVTSDQIATAWELFEDKDSIDVGILINGGYTDHVVHRAMERLAEYRGDAFAVLDMPKDRQETTAASMYKINELNLDSSHYGIYTPNVIVTDSKLGKKISVPPSGFIAGVMAHTDKQRGVWFAPAGINRGLLKIEGLEQHYGQARRDSLSKVQVNCIRNIPGQGYCVWDQQTGQRRASSLQWVNVRRLTNYILKSVSLSAIHNLFDPNDNTLRTSLRMKVEDFMEPIRIGRGITKYRIICDTGNNTPDTIANGDVILDLHYDPTISAKRVHVTFNINPTGSFATDNF
jgi:phage tail sheath protein FI